MIRMTRQYGKRQKLALLLLVLGGIVAAAVLLYTIGMNLERAEVDPLAEQAQNGLPSVRTLQRQTVEYQGVQYALKKNLTTILLIGVDKAEETDTPDLAFRSGGQADYLSLMVIDEKAKTIHRINIDRDTIAEITVLSALGKPKGTRMAQIALAHAYGGDMQQSAALTVNAVKDLLQGVDIDDFITFKMESISVMNELAGGVSVLIEEDLTVLDPAFIKGEQVHLAGDQAERFVRARRNVTDGTNLNRMQRQNIFLSAFFDHVRQKLQEDPGFVKKLLDTLNPYMTNSLRVGRLSNLLYKIRGYTVSEPYSLSGERKVNAMNNMEFYPDEDSVMKAILSAFYEELAAAEPRGN
jgi:LCP family protein required for cell wall assembly